MTDRPTPTPAVSPDAISHQPTQDGSSPTLTGPNGPSAAASAYPFLSPPVQPGDLGRLGGYRVILLLGEGGMGFVFRAEDEGLQRPVALKVMRPEVAARPTSRERFLREGRAAAAVKSDHVITIYQVGEENGVPFLAMEVLEGMTLDEWLKARHTPPDEKVVLKVARDVLKGLAAAHARGLIHRDIKPANLWMERDTSRVKLLDFGLTHLTGAEAEHLTQSGAVMGTPAYMAPEQADGKKVDARTDLFSLGVVLYRMAAGHSPFKRDGTLSTLLAVATVHPTPPTGLSPAVSDVVMRLMSKDPAGRPASADAATEEFRQATAGLPGGPASKTHPVPLPPPIVEPLPEPGPDPWAGIEDGATEPPEALPQPPRPGKPRQRFRVAAGLAGLLVLLLGGFIIIKVTNKDGSVTELKVPDDSRVEVTRDGKTIAVVPAPKTPPGKAADPVVKLDPLPKLEFTPIPVGESPFDRLDRSAIPKAERVVGQPMEVVGVIGTHARRHWSQILSVAISPDGKRAATGGGGGDCMVLWDLETQTEIRRFGSGSSWLHQAESIQFAANGRHLLANIRGNGSGVRLLDLNQAGGTLVPIHVGDKSSVEWFHQAGSVGQLLEAANTFAAWQADALTLFSWNDGAPKLVTEKLALRHPLLAGEASQILYLSTEGKLRRAAIKDGALVDDVELPIPLEPDVQPRALRADGKVLALKVKDRIELWDIAAEQPRKLKDLRAGGSDRLFLSADGRWLASKYTQTALYRIDGPEPKFVCWLDQTAVGNSGGVAFDRVGNRAVVGSGEGFVRFWDLSGNEPKELSPLDPATVYKPPHYSI